MANSGSPRFEVSVNGEALAMAGVESYGVLTTILTWVLREPARVPDDEAHLAVERGGCVAEEFMLDVGGLDPAGHLRWGRRELQVGDKVEIRVLPPGPTSKPTRFDPPTCA